jgi:MraZ protein
MSEPNNKQTIHYTSLFEHGVDTKRRVQIPAKWRPSEPDVEFTLILWPNGGMADSHLLVLPPIEMNALVEKLRGMSSADSETMALRRLIGTKSATVSLDKSGRICIPDTMAKKADIGDKALMVGLVDRFEVWSPERYRAASAVDEALLPKAFKLI